MPNEKIDEAKDRVRALRAQIREEQTAVAVANAEAADEHRLKALDEEEQMLLRQLETVRKGRTHAEELRAAETAESVGEAVAPLEEFPEGTAIVETVDSQGNLVRTAATEADVVVVTEGETTPDEVVGTRESDPPPPDTDNATLGRGRTR